MITQSYARPDVGMAMARFPVEEGSALEMRLLFQSLSSENPALALDRAPISVAFVDAEGRVIDPCLATGAVVVPLPRFVEVLPPGPRSDAGDAAATACWYLPVPPDAVELRLSGWPETVTLRTARAVASAINWGGPSGRQALNWQAQLDDERRRLITRLFPATRRKVLALACETATAQMTALAAYYQPGGSWSQPLSAIRNRDARRETRIRRDRLRAQGQDGPRLGFIGSERGFERLSWLTDAVWLREAEYLDQFRDLDLETVVIEVAASGGAGATGGAWNQAFASLTGDLPERGAALMAAAREAGASVHLWLTGGAQTAPFWRGALAAADLTIAEGTAAEWAHLQPDHIIRRATEPAACSLAAVAERQADLLLVPTASDAYQFADFKALIDATSLYDTLLAEFRYNFASGEFSRHFNNQRISIYNDSNRMIQREALLAARVVLLRATSLRPSAELAEIAMDAIASGAVPILYGPGGEDQPLLAGLDRIHDAGALRQLLQMLRIGWYRERRLRALLREVWANHVWQAEDRAAILGRDPFGAEFDRPKITAVLVSKRPHLIENCLETFRKQSWPEKELVLILNTGRLPDTLPELRENERIFALPEAANIGECLNMGIAAAAGRYWVKLDDDDFYSRTYLEETAGYYRSAQADIVGRQSVYYYFDAIGSYSSRDLVASRCFKMLAEDEHISGATLSAAQGNGGADFSQKDRNACDSNWVQRNLALGLRMFCGDSTSLMVYRDADESRHTWQMSRTKSVMAKFIPRGPQMFERMESQ